MRGRACKDRRIGEVAYISGEMSIPRNYEELRHMLDFFGSVMHLFEARYPGVNGFLPCTEGLRVMLGRGPQAFEWDYECQQSLERVNFALMEYFKDYPCR